MKTFGLIVIWLENQHQATFTLHTWNFELHQGHYIAMHLLMLCTVHSVADENDDKCDEMIAFRFFSTCSFGCMCVILIKTHTRYIVIIIPLFV